VLTVRIFLLYFNFKIHSINHVVIEYEQYYGRIKVVRVHT
jgi:hypothetical protein